MRKNVLLILITCLTFIFCFNVGADIWYGDVSGDGRINAEDALVVLKHAAYIESMSGDNLKKADVNKDESINAEDALYILQYAAGIIDSFEENATDIVYGDAQFLDTACEDHNETWTPRVRVFTTYGEYEEYIEPIKKRYEEGEYKKELSLYEETFFDKNSLIIVDYTNTDYDEKVYFKNMEYLEDEEIYEINLEHYSSVIQSPMLRPIEIIIPIEKKDISADDFKVNIIGFFDISAYKIQASRARPITTDPNKNYPVVLKNYEEYAEYVALFKAANPDYELKKEYTKEEFEYYNLDIIVGGFWTSSGQMDIEYVNTVRTEGKYIINFNGKCPSEHTDDSYYYHYMLESSFVKITEESIEVNVDVEYY